MNCRYVQSRLSAYLDFELSGVEQQLIRSHLEQCIECSEEFESLRRTKELLRQMPVVASRSGPEQVLLRVRQATPPPRRAIDITWRAPRWWQFAGGLALATAFMFWSRFHEGISHTQGTESSSTTNFTVSSPILNSISSPELFSSYRPNSLFWIRRSANPVTEPMLLPSVSYTDPMLGYQPVSDWNGIAAEPKMIDVSR
ncbi:MAG: hypothetical protein CFK49_03715 [Armatimonadetes bacterium JP3_11]|jgi:hypothetical protein|nr:MAG: hypothetical protein CFK48_04770 [Armatimonadetes bacterium CP1_7O]OYT75360.1 MAG: hypothetical protein CFK49_03715 [Armatimonadetes bacterium JP3_11]RMH06204.1 MAG: hypothetical protein D6697_11200 [Armatimonadota bacterium]